MEWDLPGVEVQEQEEVSDEGEGLEVGWEEHAPEPDPAGVVSAPVVEPDFLTKSGLLAMTSVVPSAAPRW